MTLECCGDWKEGIETYRPSCAKLKNDSLQKISRENNDYFFVHTSQDYFYVFGINIEPSKPT